MSSVKYCCGLLLISMVGTLHCTSAPLVRCGKEFKSVLTVAFLVAGNANETMVMSKVGGGDLSLRLARVWS
jgi:hypothetical protein